MFISSGSRAGRGRSGKPLPSTGSTNTSVTNAQVIFANSGVEAGSTGFTFNYTTNTVNLANTLLLGTNVTINSTTLGIGNTIAYSFANSILMQVVNSTATLNLQPTQIVLGSASVNTTAFISGANVFFDTVKMSFGNSTANLLANSILVTLANSTATANLSPATLVIGGSTVNATAYAAGANVFLSTTTLSVGNSVANLLANSILVKVSNSTSTVNVTPAGINVGADLFINTTSYGSANIFLSTLGTFYIGNPYTNAPVESGNTVNPQLQAHGSGTFQGSLLAYNWKNSAVASAAPVIGGAKSRGVVPGTHAVVSSGDVLCSVIAYGDNATDFVNAARIQMLVDGTANATQMPGRITFSTTGASNTLNEVMRIDSGGNTGIGTTAPAHKLEVNGDILVTTLLLGNSTANVFANSILIQVANATATLNLQPTQIVLGSASVNTTAFISGANVFLDTTKLSIGNSTANLLANSILVSLANSTGTANLQPTQLIIGSATVNSTAHIAGANVFLDTTKLSIGNTTANLLANSILITLANSTATANLNPAALVIGASTVNATAYTAGANVFLSTTTLSIGNSTANLLSNSILITLANSTATANLSPATLVIGVSTVNGTAYAAGANVFVDTVKMSMGNSIANSISNSIIFQVSNATGIANLTPTTLVIGSSTVNSTAYTTGANVFLNNTLLNIGNSTVNCVANSSDIVVNGYDLGYVTAARFIHDFYGAI